MHQPTGEDKVDREDGTKEGTKGEWLKEPEVQATPVSTVDR